MASTGYPTRPRTFLPRDPRVAEPYRLTPRLAFRIGILGALALAAFALLILRLWALQVLSGDEYLQVAKNNELRRIPVEAPRGQILDRDGKRLVDNTKTTSVRLWPTDLPDKGRYRVVRNLAHVLGVPLPDLLRKIERYKKDPLTPVTVRRNVSEELARFLLERGTQFPGVVLYDEQTRRYPRGALASHVLGHVGEITPQQLRRLDGYRLGDRIGQGGVEGAFDRFLRGRPGLEHVRFDAAGRPRTDAFLVRPPLPGDTVRTTLDADLQQAAEQAILTGIGLAHENDNWYASGGAAVAMDNRTGEVLALASWPEFDPGVYSNPSKAGELPRLTHRRAAERHNFPGLNRAIANLYPPGSTFKPVTALAAVQEGLIGPYDVLPCPPAVYYGRDRHEFRNWTPDVGGSMDLPTALEQSCDTYFYALGYEFYKLPESRGHPLQDWAGRWGFGRPTGLDIGGELPGLLPTPEWRLRTFTKEHYPDNWQVERLWKPGDSVQLAIGQKDLLVTPLQLTAFYAMIANDGRIVRPHLLRWVEESAGENRASPLIRRRYVPPPPRESGISPAALAAVRQGLYEATHGSTGTATHVFGTFEEDVAGKTGTAEKYVPEAGRLVDQSWFCGYAPADDPELTVCVVIENGGFGGEAAAPAALTIFQRYFGTYGGNASSVAKD